MDKVFRKKSSKADLQTAYSCNIRFLDDSEQITLPFKKDTIGQWLIERVCEKLNIVEKDYFGLRYVDSEKQRHWLDPIKTVYKQMKGVNPMVLCFRVKFYPAEPMKLHEEITRYFMFLQLRRDLHHGRLLCSPQDAILLAAYIVQSEVGDYDQEDHPPGYISEFKMLPKQNAKMEEQIMEMHKTLKGQVPSEAESNFLKKACQLDTYGVDPHQVKDSRGDQLYLGVTHQGIMTFRGSRRTQLFKWAQVKRLAYEGKMFIAHVNITEDEEMPNPKKDKYLCTGSLGKQQPVGFKCATAAACKYLWRCAVEQQLFFTLSNTFNTPKIKSGGTLFSRGSKFRFSGRCQVEAYNASENIKREEPNFNRTSSLPNFARKHDRSTLKDASITSDIPVREDLSKKYNVNTWSPRVISETSMIVRTPPSPPKPTPVVIPPKISVPDIVYPTTKDRVGESAIDVPKNLSGAPGSPSSLVQSGPTVKAPLAQAEEVIEATQGRVSQVPSQMSTPIRKENGSAVSASPGRIDNLDTTTLSYNPDLTQDEDDEDDNGKPRTSLDDQIKQLEDQYSKLQSEPNNVSGKTEGAVGTSTADKKAVAAKGGKSGCATCCKALFISLFFVTILATVTFYILFYSEIRHPIVNDLRKQTIFLQPVKEFVDAKVKLIQKALK